MVGMDYQRRNKTRLPVSQNLLKKVTEQPSQYINDLSINAAFKIAWAGFLRLDEITEGEKKPLLLKPEPPGPIYPLLKAPYSRFFAFSEAKPTSSTPECNPYFLASTGESSCCVRKNAFKWRQASGRTANPSQILRSLFEPQRCHNSEETNCSNQAIRSRPIWSQLLEKEQGNTRLIRAGWMKASNALEDGHLTPSSSVFVCYRSFFSISTSVIRGEGGLP